MHSTQSDISEIQQVSGASNHKKGNTEEARVVMVDKVIHVSEVTSEKVDTLIIPNQDNLHRETIDQSNSKTRSEEILPCGSSVLENTEGIRQENTEPVSDYC